MCVKSCHPAEILDLQWWIPGLVGIFVIVMIAATRLGPLSAPSLSAPVASLPDVTPAMTSEPPTDALEWARSVAEQAEAESENLSADGAYQLWQATELCNVNPSLNMSIQSDIPAISSSQERALDSLLRWCDVALGGLDFHGDPNQLARQALDGGSLLAEAYDLVRIELYESPEYARALARDFLSMRDPQMLNAVVGYIIDRPEGYDPAIVGLDLHMMSETARATIFEYAAGLVSCRLGADCSASSPHMLRMCLYDGHCDRDYESVLREDLLSPRDFHRTTLLAEALYDGLHTGDYALFDL